MEKMGINFSEKSINLGMKITCNCTIQTEAGFKGSMQTP